MPDVIYKDGTVDRLEDTTECMTIAHCVSENGCKKVEKWVAVGL